MIDYFNFWMAKALVDLVISFSLLGIIGIFVLILVYMQNRRK